MIRETYTTVVRSARRRPLFIAAAALLLALLAAIAIFALPRSGSKSPDTSGRRILYWYDPMVPNEHYPGPGKSSMGMALQPKYADESGEGGVKVSAATMQNLGIRLARVETRDIAPVVRSVGHVAFDERLLTEVQTLTPGFVESLSVRAEGEPVSAGRVIARVYSPELLAAQNEYKALLTTNSVASESLRTAARSRLLLLGAPQGLVNRLRRGGSPQRTYPVTSPRSGVITAIGARPGAQVSLGQSIVTVQGLSRVLVMADVPEASLGNVHRGQPAQITFPAYPGDVRTGVVDYIFPSLDAQSRTAQVRITLSNPGGKLKQGQFANVSLQGTGGMAMVVPSEAVIDTGRRKVVVVKRDGSFVPQEVTTGRDYDEYTQIVAGLRPGEQIVASGQFLIDSEASLQGFLSRLQNNPAPAPMVANGRGIVTSVDPQNGRVTISHGPIPALGWTTPMTMTFTLREASMLRGLRKGLRVDFSIRQQPDGRGYVIERIAPESGR